MAKSILVADSDENNRELLCRMLKIFGYEEISKASDGLDALYQVVQKAPGLVVVDAQLPKLDGFLMTEILHNVTRFREIPVALMTTSIDAQVMERGMFAGAYAFLEKPVTPEGVKRVLGGVGASTSPFPEKISKPAQAIVSEIADAAKTMLTLIFGQQGKVVNVEIMTPEAKAKKWEIAGVIKADGVATIEIALGTSKEAAKALATGLGKKDLGQTSLGQAIGEILTSTLNRSSKKINDVYAVKAAMAQVAFDVPLAINQAAKECYVIHLRVVMQGAILRKQLGLALAVTITPR